ncbi:carboxypeptidase regulatory-like domain-containing protein [bacterium]|nr:carboxypeptidase regulatory-like domain-containing protein [bacterium]
MRRHVALALVVALALALLVLLLVSSLPGTKAPGPRGGVRRDATGATATSAGIAYARPTGATATEPGEGDPREIAPASSAELAPVAPVATGVAAPRKVALRGRVLLEGRPIAGARVTLVAVVGARGHRSRVDGPAMADALSKVDPERREAAISALESACTLQDLARTTSDARGEFAIAATLPASTRSAELTGYVETAGVHAMGGAWVELDLSEQSLDIELRAVARFVVVARARGMALSDATVIVLSLRRHNWWGGSFGSSSSWRVTTDDTGRPPSAFDDSDTGFYLCTRATTDAAGEAAFVVEGESGLVSIGKPGYATAYARVPLDRRAEIELSPSSLVAGYVVDAEDRPVEGSLVRAHDADGVGRSEVARTGADGAFELHDLAASRRLSLWATVPDGRKGLVAGKLSVSSPASNVRIALVAEARVRVVLAIAEDARPGSREYAHPELLLERLRDADAWEQAALGRGPLTRGTRLPPALVSGLRPGTYRLRAGGSGLIGASLGPFELASGDRSEPLSLELHRARMVRGRVLSSQGEPLRATVQFDGWRGKLDSAYCDLEGRFSIDELPWEETTIDVSELRYLPAKVHVPARVSDLPDVTLEPERK